MIGRVVRWGAGASEIAVAWERASETAGAKSGVSGIVLFVDVGTESVGSEVISGEKGSVSGRKGSSSSNTAGIDSSNQETGVLERRTPRDFVSVHTEICRECSLFAAGKTFSQKSVSPVTNICLVILLHSRHALAFDSIPTKTNCLATGPTLDFC